jgi:hypothetical protein
MAHHDQQEENSMGGGGVYEEMGVKNYAPGDPLTNKSYVVWTGIHKLKIDLEVTF